MNFFRKPEYQSLDVQEVQPMKSKIKQESKSTTGFLSKGATKAAIGVVPVFGSAINSMVEETQNALDNREAKNKLLEEIKYSILLVHSCQNLIDYIDRNQFSKYLCDFDNLQIFKSLQIKLIEKLREIKTDDELKLSINSEIENLYIKFFIKNMDKTYKEDPKYRSQRKAIIDREKDNIGEKMSLLCPSHFNFYDSEKQIAELKPQIEKWEKIIDLAELLTNDGLSPKRLFIIENEKIVYLKLEDFLKSLGLDKFSNSSQFDRYTSNISKYLHNLEKIHEWIIKPENAIFSRFSGNANSRESDLIIPLLYYYTTMFQKTVEALMDMRQNSFKNQDDLESLLKKIYSAQVQLTSCDLYDFGLLMSAFNNPTKFKNQIDIMKSSLGCLESGLRQPQTRERLKMVEESVSTAKLLMSLVNFRIDLNIVATQLNTYYQDLLFQILQIKTTDPSERDAMLCPNVSLDLFI